MANTLILSPTETAGTLLSYIWEEKGIDMTFQFGINNCTVILDLADATNEKLVFYSHGMRVVEVTQEFADSIGGSVWSDLRTAVEGLI